MLVLDQNYYPLPFKSFKHTAYDADGNPTTTVFYKNNDLTTPVFTWTRTWKEGSDGFYVDSWKVELN